MARSSEIARVFGAVLSSHALRRVLSAFFLFTTAEYAIWIAVTVYAYGHGGATAAGVVMVAQLVPAALVAPLGATLGDRLRRDHALALGYTMQAAADAALALALWGGPPLLAYGIAVVANCAVSLTRPVHYAILPQLAETPDELTASNGASAAVESLGVLVGPLLAALLIGVGGSPSVAAISAVCVLTAGALTFRLRSPGDAAPSPAEAPPDQETAEPRRLIRDAIDGFRELHHEPGAWPLLLLGGAQFVVVGLLDVFYAVLAISVLDVGGSGAGVLAAVVGLGGLVGAGLTVFLVGRQRLTPAMELGLFVCGLSLSAAGIGAVGFGGAAALLLLCGAGRAFFDVATRTLLQRSVPDDVLARVFGLQEALVMLGLAVGSAAAPLLVTSFGPQGALVAAGAFLPLVGLLAWSKLRQVDNRAVVPGPELDLLRRIQIFAPLPQHVLEQLSWHVVPVHADAGHIVIRQGDPGDRFYLVVDGHVEVTVDGRPLAEIGPGGYFGEIALLRNVPRTATVTAATPVRLLALERAQFLAAVTGSRPSSLAANREIDQRVEEVEALSRSARDEDADPGGAVTQPQRSVPNHTPRDTE
jgi:predicted MFS family arabinose efflux permease